MHRNKSTMLRGSIALASCLIGLAGYAGPIQAQSALQRQEGQPTLTRAGYLPAQTMYVPGQTTANDGRTAMSRSGSTTDGAVRELFGDPLLDPQPLPQPSDGGYEMTESGDPPPDPQPPPPPPGGGYERVDTGSQREGSIHRLFEQERQAVSLGNYPNPFNPETTIRFELVQPQRVRLTVFNALGQAVQVLVDGWVEAGGHEARFVARQLPSGTYFTRLETEAGVVTRSMVLAK